MLECRRLSGHCRLKIRRTGGHVGDVHREWRSGDGQRDGSPERRRHCSRSTIFKPRSDNSQIKDAAQGKVVVDAVVPLVPPKISVVSLPPQGSAAQIAQTLFGPGVKVTSAFHTVGSKKLRPGERADCDVLVFGNDKDARDLVIRLSEAVVLRGIDAGPLANSVAAEALTSVLIGINRRYKVEGAGLRITNL
jgi:predicted dinucleotide-binding enzyme